MADRISKARRSWNMSRIKARDTKPEVQVRSILHRMGLRFRLHRADLPGKPDIVLVSRRTVVFVHGCFWHRHGNCRYAYSPKSRKSFWERKFAENVKRDQIQRRRLLASGWKSVVVWECELLNTARLTRRLHRLLAL